MKLSLTKIKIVLEEIGAPCLADLKEIYVDADLVKEVKLKVSSLDFKRFVKAAQITKLFEGIEYFDEKSTSGDIQLSRKTYMY